MDDVISGPKVRYGRYISTIQTKWPSFQSNTYIKADHGWNVTDLFKHEAMFFRRLHMEIRLSFLTTAASSDGRSIFQTEAMNQLQLQ